jgi:hypothetical protein
MTAREIEDAIFCDGMQNNTGHKMSYTEKERIELIKDHARQYHAMMVRESNKCEAIPYVITEMKQEQDKSNEPLEMD